MLNHVKQLLKIMVMTVIAISLGATGIVNAQGNNGKEKVTICHVPPGNPANAHTITVSENALSAHLGHGDYEGPCADTTEEVDVYVQLTGVIVEYYPLLGLIRLEDGTLVILYEPTDLDLQPGTEILVYGYQIEEGRFLAMIVTTDLELAAGEPIPRLPVWIDLTGQVSGYNAELGMFVLDDSVPVILTVAVSDDLVIENGMMLTVHGELLADGRLLADDVSVYDIPDTDAEIPTEGPVTICHVPPGNSNNAHTITVGAPAVPAHLAHGDYLGACGEGDSADNITNDTTVVQTTCEGACNPVLVILADSFGVAYTDLVALQEQGYRIGEIARCYVIAQHAGADVDEIATLYAEGNGWGQVMQQYPDINPSDVRANSNLGNGRR